MIKQKIPEETKKVAKVGTKAIEQTAPAKELTQPAFSEAAVPKDVEPVATVTQGEEKVKLPTKTRPKLLAKPQQLPAKPKPQESEQDYGGAVLDGAIKDLGGEVNLGVGTNAVNYALEALQKQAKVLALADYDSTKPELVARSAAHTAKVIDETMRLIAFSKGGPDSRTETKSAEAEQAAFDEIFRGLTDDQFTMFSKWMAEAKERDANKQNKQ